MDVWRTIVDDSHYAFPPSNTALRRETYKKLTGWRAGNDWIRACPTAYGRGAVNQVVVACKRAIDDVSIYMPFRRKDGRIIVSSVKPPTRKRPFQLYIPGFGILETKDPIEPDWVMKSFRLVDVTPEIPTPETHKQETHKPAFHRFEIHISIKYNTPERKPTGVVCGVDVGCRHLAAVADSNNNEHVYDTRRKPVLREIDRLKSERDRKRKGGRKWTEIDRKIKRLQRKSNNIATDTINQAMAKITTGVDAVMVEDLHVKSMTVHGGNRKRRLNRSMRENRAGAFLSKLESKSGMRGIALEKMDPHNTSVTCRKCGNVDKESRNRDVFHCMTCRNHTHADVNAAHNILAAGMVVVRRRRGGNAKSQRSAINNRAPISRCGSQKGISLHLCI